MKAETRTAKCQHCQNPFEVKARYSNLPGCEGMDVTQLQNRTCPKCQSGLRKAAHDREQKRMKLSVDGKSGKPVLGRGELAKAGLKRMAQILKTTQRNASRIERQALSKIRNDPVLAKLYKEWMADGGRIPERAPDPEPQEATGVLLDFMMGISEWYQTHTKLVRGGKKKEALECMSEIRNFYQSLRQQLKKYGITVFTGDYNG